MNYVPPLYKYNSHQYHYSLNVYNSSFSVSFKGIVTSEVSVKQFSYNCALLCCYGLNLVKNGNNYQQTAKNIKKETVNINQV